MVLASVGTTPRTAYSASLTQGLTSVQKKLDFLVENLAMHLCNIVLISIISRFNEVTI